MTTDRYNKVNFADINLHDYFRILEIKRSVLPSITNFSKEIPGVDGEFFTGTKYGVRKITLSCAILSTDKEDYMDTIKNIAFILDVKVPSVLILGDDQDVFYYAKIEGSTDLDKIKNMGTFEINFICYDPYGYSVEEDFFESENNKEVFIENDGTTDANPNIKVTFNNTAHFLQCSDHNAKTVLVGQPPKITTPSSSIKTVLSEPCEELTNWNVIGNIVDAGRNVNGNLIINNGGWGIALGDAGSNDSGWHGGGLRRNIGQNLQDFKIEVKMSHNSKGDVNGTGGGSNGGNSSGSKYKITAKVAVNIRSDRGKQYKKLGSIPRGKIVAITDIKKNWGKVSYNGIIGFIYMDYAKKESTSSTSKTVKYKVKTKSGLIVRSGRGTKYKRLIVMPYGTIVSINTDDIKSNWGKVTYKGKTGYSSMQYLSKVTTSKAVTLAEEEAEPSTENKIGICEVYGFDQNGTKLFKFQLSDEQEWHEYTEPSIEFGSTVMVEDKKTCPAPKTTTKTEDGKKVTYKVDSGKFGDWNEFKGWFTLQRKTEGGVQKWYAKVEKIDDNGTVTRKIESKTVSGDYPKGELNNIVVFIGGYKAHPLVDYMNVHHIKVTNLNNVTAQTVYPIFEQGDELLIDSTNRKIYKNGRLFMSELDIGSQFFSCPVGESQIECKSDDKDIDITTSLRKRWI